MHSWWVTHSWTQFLTEIGIQMTLKAPPRFDTFTVFIRFVHHDKPATYEKCFSRICFALAPALSFLTGFSFSAKTHGTAWLMFRLLLFDMLVNQLRNDFLHHFVEVILFHNRRRVRKSGGDFLLCLTILMGPFFSLYKIWSRNPARPSSWWFQTIWTLLIWGNVMLSCWQLLWGTDLWLICFRQRIHKFGGCSGSDILLDMLFDLLWLLWIFLADQINKLPFGNWPFRGGSWCQAVHWCHTEQLFSLHVWQVEDAQANISANWGDAIQLMPIRPRIRPAPCQRPPRTPVVDPITWDKFSPGPWSAKRSALLSWHRKTAKRAVWRTAWDLWQPASARTASEAGTWTSSYKRSWGTLGLRPKTSW